MLTRVKNGPLSNHPLFDYQRIFFEKVKKNFLHGQISYINFMKQVFERQFIYFTKSCYKNHFKILKFKKFLF